MENGVINGSALFFSSLHAGQTTTLTPQKASGTLGRDDVTSLPHTFIVQSIQGVFRYLAKHPKELSAHVRHSI